MLKIGRKDAHDIYIGRLCTVHLPKPTNEVHILALYLLHLSFSCLTISVRNYCARLEGKKETSQPSLFWAKEV